MGDNFPERQFVGGQFSGVEKKELALKMKNLYDFSYSLMHTL